MRPILVAAFVVGLLVFLAGPAPASVSFFDIFPEVTLAPASPAPPVTDSAGQYGFGGSTDTIIQRTSDTIVQRTIDATGGTQYQVTADYPIYSFFDVFTSADGSPSPVPLTGTLTVQFTLPWDPSQPPPSGTTPGGTTSFDAEILSMNLTGSGGGYSSIAVSESATGSYGDVTVTDTGGGTFHISSFFAVFTEVSLDGGPGISMTNGGSNGDGGFAVSGSASSTPEPSTIIIWSLLGGLGIAIGWWRRKRAA
jgi:hypothetical protein